MVNPALRRSEIISHFRLGTDPVRSGIGPVWSGTFRCFPVWSGADNSHTRLNDVTNYSTVLTVGSGLTGTTVSVSVAKKS